MCLPRVQQEDVKIITGYYWFWMKCGNIVAGAEHGGGSSSGMVALEKELTQCGQTNCPRPGPPPHIQYGCEKELYAACYSKRTPKEACDLCTLENTKRLPNCTRSDKQAFCNVPPPPPFDPSYCYYEACPKRSPYDDDALDDYDDSYGGSIAEGRRRLFVVGAW